MTKFKYDKTNLSLVKNSLNDTISDLNSAIYNSSFSVPGDFTYRTYLANLKSTLSGYCNDVASLSNWIQSSMVKIDETLNTMNIDTTNNLKVSKIQSKSHTVKTN